MTLSVPTKHNQILTQVIERVNADQELLQLWKCANINVVDRLGMSDHGEVHIKIIANIALRLLRLLVDGGVEMSVVKDHKLTNHDAEVIVVLAACLHDLGIAIHRDNHEEYSLFLAWTKVHELLDGLYNIPQRTAVITETLHAINAHSWDVRCLTIEAGVLKVADALDMTQGRSRIGFEAGTVNIHAVSAQAIDSVNISKGEDKPIRIEIAMSNSAGIFQVDELLKRKLRNSSIAQYVEVMARIEGETERRLLEVYTI
jgi:uncharacterized protein